MLNYKNRIVFTGGTGRFGKIFKNKEKDTKFKFYFPSRKQLNILNINSVESYLKLTKPKYLIHLAGLSRPMNIHNKEIDQSIDKNIIGTAIITKACYKFKIKLFRFKIIYI